MIRDFAQTTRRYVNSVMKHEPFWHSELNCPKLRVGTSYGGFVVNPTQLPTGGLIYSFGIGTDISFDLGSIERFSATVEVFDPTPRSLQWITSQKLPASFHMHDYGLAGFDGSITLYPPANPAHASYSQIDHAGEAIECSVLRLRTIMKMLGHNNIDLLKVDIEGAEYDALADILSEPLNIPQICLEFHHFWPEYGCSKTQCAIDMLHAAGYRIFDVSPLGREFSFLKVN